MKFSPITVIALALLALVVPACKHAAEEHHEEQRKLVVTSPLKKDVIVTEQYVCQIHSQKHIEVRALEGGYLQKVPVKEGQSIKQGELMFKIVPTLYQAKADAEKAEAQLAQIEYENTKRLYEQKVVSDQEVALAQAKLAKAQADLKLAQAELNFTDIKAPFDGIVDRLREQLGSLIEEGDILTTLSDNSVMWVYFNVPESRYLEYKAELHLQQSGSKPTDDKDDKDDDKDDDDDVDDADEKHDADKKHDADDKHDHDDDDVKDAKKGQDDLKLELVLANANTFPQPGEITAIEADFNNETGNIAFRADFSNPDGLLRHGQTGTVLIHRKVHDAIVIPQRATFDILAKKYVFVIGKDGVVHQRDIEVGNTLDDVYLIKSGLNVDDKIVLEGVLQVRDGEKVEFEYRDPQKVLGELKNKAE